ncbi:MucR family transcriptional regulator [Pseudooceanicola sp. LIPI14-2-Ac024]|uniref:MucR family transcriptional regulator n=1 Tax=Pseudooceanicola sp. LIPI14-2-Ac024 TaxID=3344875 RepID=UPI0035CEBD64
MKNLIRRFMGRFVQPAPTPEPFGAPPPGPGPSTLTCLETGVRRAVLHRHIRQTLGMTPDQYRKKWGLPPDYPMVSEAYIKRREAARNKKNRA